MNTTHLPCCPCATCAHRRTMGAARMRRWRARQQAVEAAPKPKSASAFWGFRFVITRCTPKRHLVRSIGCVEAFIPGTHPTRAMQQLAEQRIRRDPHTHLILRITPHHPATQARRLPSHLVTEYHLA